MSVKRIPLITPHMSDEGYELEYIHDAFEKNWIAPAGENLHKFEDELKELVGADHALAVSSGTAAIHLALKCCSVGPGDCVFVQSLTFAASANPIIYEGAQPIFIDSEADSWNMSPDCLREAFSKYQPKAVIVVHLYGVPSKIEEIVNICKEHKVPLIEDAAESLGSTINGQWTGSFGDYGIISFNGNKIITTSSGGMLLSNNRDGLEKARYWATQAREPVRHYEHRDIGYNYRLSNISAGIGRGQLKVLDQRVKQKRYIFDRYKKNLGDLDGVSFIEEREGERSNYWLSTLLVDHPSVTPMLILDALLECKIEGRPVWKPMHLQPIYREKIMVGDQRNADAHYNFGLCLPSDTKFDDSDIDKISEIVRKLWDK